MGDREMRRSTLMVIAIVNGLRAVPIWFKRDPTSASANLYVNGSGWAGSTCGAPTSCSNPLSNPTQLPGKSVDQALALKCQSYEMAISLVQSVKCELWVQYLR
jgi:hypothetical protein